MNKLDTRWIALGIFFAAILLRFVPHFPNVTPIAALALFAGCYLSRSVGIVLAVGAMALSDFIGQAVGSASIYTYSPATMISVYVSLGLIAVVGRQLHNRVSPPRVIVASLVGSALFFLSTNFACWLDPVMAYPPTPAGLLQCYTLAIPFGLSSVIGDLLYSALFIGGYEALVKQSPHWSSSDRVTHRSR